MIGGKSVAELFCMSPAVAALALLGFTHGARLAAHSTNTGAVYVLSNQPAENAVIVFHRSAHGTLEPGGSFPTGGAGFGTGSNPLGSQGLLILSADNRLLFAVNAGSDSITAFAVAGDALTPLQTISSGGTQPVSLTVHHDLLYVLNAGGGAPNITGFRIVQEAQQSKTLAPIVGSTQPLPNGMDNQTASTWATVTEDGRIAFTSNTMSGTISSYAVSPKTDSLTLVQPTAASLVAQDGGSLMPAGMALSSDGRCMYVRRGGKQTVSGFLVHSDGSVTPVAQASGLPNTAAGIAAR